MDQELLERVRALRATGRTPKEIARALGLRPAQVAPLVRGIAAADAEALGLVSVLVTRQERYGRVRLCGWLVDVYCLGVKDVVGPRVMDERRAADFRGSFFAAYQARPLEVPLELARHLVFGAVEYARGLGFEPARGFAATADQLGSWAGPSAIRFGRDGKPFFVQGRTMTPTPSCRRWSAPSDAASSTTRSRRSRRRQRPGRRLTGVAAGNAAPVECWP